MAEIFSGRSAIYHAYNNADSDEIAVRFDCRVHLDDNAHTRDGCYKIARLLVGVDPDGYAMFEPTCGSWVWLNKGSSLRGVVPSLH